MKPPFKDALPILERLEQEGFQAYFVGGAVRDSLLNRPIDDVDIATSATPKQVQELFQKTIPIGIEHGTILVRYNNQSFEVTTFRTESDYQDFRHPETVEFVKDIELDLSRRDFTMNAIAMDRNGKCIDPYLGQTHIREKRIETVRDADERFCEDPLRMMRALRFVSQIGFQLGLSAEEAIIRNQHLLRNIAVERIAAEMEKLWKGSYIHQALSILIKTEIGRSLPIFKDHDSLIEACLNRISTPFHSLPEAITCMHLLHQEVSIDEWCKLWKLSKSVKNRCHQLTRVYHYYQHQGLKPETLYQLTPDMIPEFVHLVLILDAHSSLSIGEVEHDYKLLPIKNRDELAINGHEILALLPDEKPGPWLRTFIERIEKQVINGSLPNDKQQIKEWVKKWNRQEKS